MKKISIIVPVYNIEQYIEECINSIINQDFQDFELLLIDDGSKDKSGEICDKYSNISNVKVFHKENGGLSDARNYGIKHSAGQYIMFIDGDDYLYDKSCLSKIANYLNKSNADIVQYKMVYYYMNNDKYVFQKDLVEFKGNFLEKMDYFNKNGKVSVSACDKIIRASMIKDNKIYFEKNLLSEDIKWSYMLYLFTKKIETLNENIYVYRQQRANSISTSRSEKNAHDLFNIIMYWYNYNYESTEIKELYYNLISYWYLILRTNYKKSYYTLEMKEKFKILDKEMFSYNQNYKVLKAYKLSKIIGIPCTIQIMKIYIYLKNKGLIKL